MGIPRYFFFSPLLRLYMPTRIVTKIITKTTHGIEDLPSMTLCVANGSINVWPAVHTNQDFLFSFSLKIRMEPTMNIDVKIAVVIIFCFFVWYLVKIKNLRKKSMKYRTTIFHQKKSSIFCFIWHFEYNCEWFIN